jgi:hypothetical protein
VTIPPRKPNGDKPRPDELPVHKHFNINGPQPVDPNAEETIRLADAIDRLNAERHWTTGAYCLAIGLLVGLMVGWASAA